MADRNSIYEDLKDMVEDEIEKITKKGELDETSLMHLDRLVDIVKDTCEIEMSAEQGYSQRHAPYYPYSMDGGNSYQRRDSMGRYSRNNSYRGNGNSYNGNYSRNGDIVDRLESMMNEAQTEREREAIRRAMEQI